MDPVIILLFICIFAVISIVLFVIGIFIIFHLRPLTPDEIYQLANKRREKYIIQYYEYNKYEYPIKLDFKKKLKPSGDIYYEKIAIVNFPAIASAILKYKKHEWIIVAFEKERFIEKYWINKGIDRSTVNNYLSSSKMVEIAKQSDYKTILILHNHPNSNPNQYNYTKPSDQDMISAIINAKELNNNGINLVEFICERGKPYKYFQNIAIEFMPLTVYLPDIQENNDNDIISNLFLHIERIF